MKRILILVIFFGICFSLSLFLLNFEKITECGEYINFSKEKVNVYFFISEKDDISNMFEGLNSDENIYIEVTIKETEAFQLYKDSFRITETPSVFIIDKKGFMVASFKENIYSTQINQIIDILLKK